MVRPKLIVSDRLPYHVRGRCNNRDWFYLPKETTWPIFLEVLQKTGSRYGWEVFAFVLMDNHYHMLCRTPQANLGECMQYFSREVSKRIGLKSGRINRIFGGRYKQTLISETNYFVNVIKYVYRNPVEAGLVGAVENYHCSSLRWLLSDDYPAPFYAPLDWMANHIPRTQAALIGWLNNAFSKKQEEAIRLGLRRKAFAWPRAKTFKRVVASLQF